MPSNDLLSLAMVQICKFLRINRGFVVCVFEIGHIKGRWFHVEDFGGKYDCFESGIQLRHKLFLKIHLLQ